MTLQDWLMKIIEMEKPDDTISAYNFGLFETETGYTVYLIGSKEFDDETSDWATEENFVPKEKYFILPPDFKNIDWEDAQEKTVSLLKQFLNSEVYQQSFFCTAEAITVGFDDGDLVRLK